MPNAHYERYKTTINRVTKEWYARQSDEYRSRQKESLLQFYYEHKDKMNKRRLELYYRQKEIKQIMGLYDAIQ